MLGALETDARNYDQAEILLRRPLPQTPDLPKPI